MTMITDRLNKIRMPTPLKWKTAAWITLCVFLAGTVLGIFSKWLDNLELDSAIWWHRFFEILDLGNFFSDISIWLLLALVIAVFSTSPLRAAFHVFAFFTGLCTSYHIYTIFFSGFNPVSYMMLWYAITLLSPLPAVLCWYARGTGTVSIVLDTGIFAVLSLSCFSTGWFYVSLKGFLYLLVFIGSVAVLYRKPQQLAVSLSAGFLLSFLFSPFFPYL